MDSYFRDRSAKVLVVDSSGASRTLLTEVIRNLGFADVHGVPTLKDALGVMEVEPVRWLLSSFYSDQSENLLQTLKLLCSHPELKQLRVSALIEETEFALLPFAFERGLLSFHRKPFTKDSLIAELKDLFSRYESCGWDSTPLAGSYLRQCLSFLNEYPDLLNFERQLLKARPGDFQQMLNLVAPLSKIGQVDEAKSVLKQVLKIEPGLAKQVKSLTATYLAGAALDDGKTQLNFLGVKTAVIVDSDTAVQNEIKTVLSEMGVESIQIFDDGETALAYIVSNPNPDIIIQEWRIPRLTGPLFLQKAQETGAKNCPIILASSLLEKEDIPFVREMGVAHVLTKPIRGPELIQGIIWTIQQDRQPTEQGSMERKMRQLLSERKLSEALAIKERFISDPTIQIGPKELIEAEFAYLQGDFEKARDFGIEAIKHAGESIFILNLLGKALISLRDFETALRCFQKAQSLAPLNLERLCQIAEIHSELGNNDTAKGLLEEVKELDPGNQRAQEGEAKLAINTGQTNAAKKIMGQLKSMENVVSYMNNQAIALARCGMVEEGLGQYRKTIEAIPDERPDIKSIVEYNIALAYLRTQKLQEAHQYLSSCVVFTQSKVHSKAEALLSKVTHALEKGLQLNLAKTQGPDKVAQEPVPMHENAKVRVLAAVDNRPGEMACFLIYTSTLDSAKIKKMLETTIRFTPRKAIEKQESMGADRIASAR